MDQLDVATGVGSGGLVMAALYFGKLWLDWRKDKREADNDAHNSVTTDAATANAILLRTVQTLQNENSRLSKRVKDLENEVEEKEQRIQALDQRIQTMQVEMNQMRHEIADMMRRHPNKEN